MGLALGVLSAVAFEGGAQAHHVKMHAGPLGGIVTSIAFDPSEPERIYVGVYGGGVLRSQGGTLWLGVNRGLADSGVHALAVDPGRPGHVLAGTASGAFWSESAGERWEASQGLPKTSVRAFAYVGEKVFAATGEGVFRSEDRGVRWSQTGPLPKDVRAVGVEPRRTAGGSAERASPLSDAPILYAATFEGLYRSLDEGRVWEPVPGADGLSGLRALALDPPRIFVGTASKGIYMSPGPGLKFQPANEGLPSPYIMTFGTHPAHPSTVYAGTLAGLYVSRDAGKRWDFLASDMTNLSITALAVHPRSSGTVLAATGGLIFRTRDGGKTWEDISLWIIKPRGE